ncbi:hypothetical protein LWF15_16680 [Kineosporia rhizophila]|uniref:hypothetical protein n=1 Tax=Kineosporia TaxID=49184 RepID=UPI001E3AFD4E|nr:MULTISPECIES: hypothetical protein [Kineosporia]MCE0537140.1 hypothetical protein [Kineosporia rhizophila]GLY16015.1 hypothetical protein Kisp01_30300 [Kineosporia sp. NBRC 101677]
MRPTQHHKELGLVGGPPAADEPEAAPARRPRGSRRGRLADPGLEVHFDPRLELAEQLLYRSVCGDGQPPGLLRQVRNLLEDARADQVLEVRAGDGIPEQRAGSSGSAPRRALPALIDLDELLLSLTQDESTSRARRIMEARRLLHRVDEEAADNRWPGEPRRRLLQQIINALAQPHPASGAPGD